MPILNSDMHELLIVVGTIDTGTLLKKIAMFHKNYEDEFLK